MKDARPNGRRRYHSDADRIHLNVAVDPVTGCWNWKRSIHHEGYGHFTLNGPMVAGKRQTKWWLAHRFSYITFVGPIPEGMELDHLCRNRACCNPAHLEPVSKRENNRRGWRWGKGPRTHCRHGHEYTDENTGQDSLGRRFCRACAKAAQARAYRRRRDAGMNRHTARARGMASIPAAVLIAAVPTRRAAARPVADDTRPLLLPGLRPALAR